MNAPNVLNAVNAPNATNAYGVAPNLLEQKFTATAPNQIWVSDITSIPTDEGWLYLAGHKDLFSGDLAGYALSARMSKSLVCQSLFRGVAEKRPPKGWIHHSDRDCDDNAPMESFWDYSKTS